MVLLLSPETTEALGETAALASFELAMSSGASSSRAPMSIGASTSGRFSGIGGAVAVNSFAAEDVAPETSARLSGEVGRGSMRSQFRDCSQPKNAHMITSY